MRALAGAMEGGTPSLQRTATLEATRPLAWFAVFPTAQPRTESIGAFNRGGDRPRPYEGRVPDTQASKGPVIVQSRR